MSVFLIPIFLFTIAIKPIKFFSFYSRGLRETLPDFDDRQTTAGVKRETTNGTERDIIL
jgi:hypothetical protein